MRRILVYSTAFLFIVSCGKKSSTQTCKIDAFTATGPAGNATFSITYNAEGQISTFVETSTTSTTNKVYTYSGNVVQISSTTSGSSEVTKDSIVVNGDGLMVSDLRRAGSDAVLTTCAYSGTELMTITSQTDGNTPSTATYTYTNGDLTGYAGSTLAYNNKASAPGDYLQIMQIFIYGVPFIKTEHQCISLQSGSTVQNFNYTYDDSGKITTMTITSSTGQSEPYNYSYECN